MSDEASRQEQEQAKARELLTLEVGKIGADRTTASGRACVSAAQQLIAMGELVEARHWVSLSLTADKANADVLLHKALKKLEEKGKTQDKFAAARRGGKTKLQAVE